MSQVMAHSVMLHRRTIPVAIGGTADMTGHIAGRIQVENDSLRDMLLSAFRQVLSYSDHWPVGARPEPERHTRPFAARCRWSLHEAVWPDRPLLPHPRPRRAARGALRSGGS